MKSRKIISLLLAMALVLGVMPAIGLVASANGTTYRERVFTVEEIKDMPYVEGTYSILSNSPINQGTEDYRYFYQKWGGTPLSYFLDTEVGILDNSIPDDQPLFKVIATDGYAKNFSRNDLLMYNDDGLCSLLAWSCGEEFTVEDPDNNIEGYDEATAKANAAASEMSDILPGTHTSGGDGPLRTVIPQVVKGNFAAGGTQNRNMMCKWMRTISVLPATDGVVVPKPTEVSADEIIVYGSIHNRYTLTDDEIRSLPQSQGVMSISGDPIGQRGYRGVSLDYLLNDYLGATEGLDVTFKAGDNYAPVTYTWPQATANSAYAASLADGPMDKSVLAWEQNRTEPYTEDENFTDCSMLAARPMFAEGDENKNRAVQSVTVMVIGDSDPGPDGAALVGLTEKGKEVPGAREWPYDSNPALNAKGCRDAGARDRIIVCGDFTGPTITPYDVYLAEGYTGPGWEEYVCIQNPTDDEANVTINCMLEGAAAIESELISVSANSRTTVNMEDLVGPNQSVSAKVSEINGNFIVVERAMYWGDKTGGHAAAAVIDPANDWYLAEGCTANDMETWVLLMNPGDEVATAEVTYLTSASEVDGGTYTLQPNTRTTINVGEKVANETDVSTMVTSDEPIIAERAMYWGDRVAGHDAVGVTYADFNWYLAEGCTANAMETWVLLMNPGDTNAEAEVTYLTASGEMDPVQVSVPAGRRVSVRVSDDAPDEFDVSTMISSDEPIIAERAVYWNDRNGGTCEAGVNTVSSMTMLAEGCTAAGFETWVLLMNPGATDIDAEITYMTDQGAVYGGIETVGAGKRVSVNVADKVPGSYNVSTLVESDGLVVERAVYWNGRAEGAVANGWSDKNAPK